MAAVARTDETYRNNFKSGLTTFPIPFFGNILTAKVLTIGVNPSADEFVGRNWPDRLDADALTHRLLHYFDLPPGPHPWFSPWTEAIALLDIDYALRPRTRKSSPFAKSREGCIPLKKAR